MPFETARTFMEALQHDTALSTQLYVASPTTLDEVVDFATGKGYIFTKEDLDGVLKLYPDSSVAQQLRQYTR
jgi:predicted ribosomally synthesized peptide with nif11-like leader